MLGVLPNIVALRKAQTRLGTTVHRTPVLRSSQADQRAGAQLFFKCENFQRTGSFKFRGALNAVRALSPEQRRAGVISFSSGNHAQALARAGQIEGVQVTVVMPHDAPSAKRLATEQFGASIVAYDRMRQDREVLAAELVEREGYTLIPPFDHPAVIAGQGTCALELFEEVGPLDALYVCLGGGGLLAGCALAAAELAPGCAVIGVEPQAGNDVQQSFNCGYPIRIEVPHTIADGAQTTRVGDLTFAIIRAKVSAIETVSDPQIVETMRFLAQWMKIVVEPTGCLAAAAAMQPQAGGEAKPKSSHVRETAVQRRLRGATPRVGVVLSGGNVDLAQYAAWLAGA
jgi:threonine dehydratase